MKTLSIIFNVLLIFPTISYLLHILELYDDKGPLKVFGVTNHNIMALAMPYIVLLVVYSIGLLISFYMNFKKAYSANVPFSGIMIVVSMFMPLLINSELVHKLINSIFHD